MAQTAEEFLGLSATVDNAYKDIPGYAVDRPQVVLGDPADVPGLTQAGQVDIRMRPADEQYVTRKKGSGVVLTLPGEETSDFGTFADEQSARTYGRRLERWNNLSRPGGLIKENTFGDWVDKQFKGVPEEKLQKELLPLEYEKQVDLLEPGNIDLDKRTPVKTRAGIVDTEDPTVVTFTDKKDPEYGKSILIPKVIDGKPLTESYAKRYYEKTGEHLGKFKNELAAREYSKKLRERQEEVYGLEPDIPVQKAEDNADKPRSLAPTGPKATPVTVYSNAGVDENSDVWTEKGYTTTGKNLVPGVAAVNPDKYPLGTILKDADSGDVFVAADKHSNKDPNVVDIYVSPEKYQRISGTRNLEVIGKEDVPKDAKGMQELLAKYKAPNTPEIPLAGDGTSIPIINAIDKDAPYMSRPRPANSIKRIVVHGDVNEDAEQLLEYGRKVDPKRGFDPGYHFYVARDGRILQGAPIERITNHIKGKNQDSIGIVIAGADNGKQPTRQQEIAAKALVSRLGKDLGIAPADVVGHGEVQANRDKREGGNIASDIRKNGYLEKSDVPLDGLVNMPPKMKDYGMVQEGTIDLSNQKGVVNPDGTVSTVLSMSFEDSDGKETLIPRVVNGRVVPPEDAIAHYRETGQHLGKFNTAAAADAYAQNLHLSEEARIKPGYTDRDLARQARGTANRQRLMDAIAESEKAGYKVPHKIGASDEPEGDRSPTQDMENLVDALHRQSADLRMKGKRGAAEKIQEKIAYWDNKIKTEGMPAEKQTLRSELLGKIEQETNRLRKTLQEEEILEIPKAELARTEKAQPAVSAEEFLGLTIPVATTKLADTLGYKQWIDVHTQKEVRRAEKFQKAEDFIEGVKPVTPAQSWWKNAINSLGRGATSEGGLMAAEGAYAMAEHLTKGTEAEKVFAPSKQNREAAGRMRDKVRDYLHVDEEFASSITGQILQGIGQLALLPLYAVPGFGEVTSAAQLWQEAKDDYKQTMGDKGTEDQANSAAFKYMVSAILPEAILNRFVLYRAMRHLIKQKKTVGQAAKIIGIMAAEGGATEAFQQFELNTIAKHFEGYDPNRRLDKEVVASGIVGLAVAGGAGVGAHATGAVTRRLKEEKPGKDTRSAEERQAEHEAQRAKKPEPPAGMPGGPISVGPKPAPATAEEQAAPAVRTKQDVWADLAEAERSGDKEATRRLAVELENVPLAEDVPGEVEEPSLVQQREQTGYTATSQPSISTTETEEESRYGPGGRGAFEHAASQVNRKFPGIPKIEVVDTFDQIRARLPAGNENLANEPVVYDQDLGRIVMIRDNMQDVPAEALQEYISRLALSQAAPVGGLHNMLEGRPEGTAYQQALLRAFPNLSVADFGTAWGDQFGYSNLVELAAMREKDLSDPRQAAKLIEEHASNVAGQPTHPEWFEQLTSDVQAILGTMGLNLNPFEASTLIQRSVPASETYATEKEAQMDAARTATRTPYVMEDFSLGELREAYPNVTLAHLDEIRIVEMPELIKFARGLVGNLPMLKKLRKARGQAGVNKKGEPYIYLHPDIWKDATVAAKVAAHEIGHMIDFFASNMKRFRGLKGLATKFPKMTETVREQLIALSHWWKPWDEATASPGYTKYRKSGIELWADAMSVFFNSPAELRKRAPMFWHAWMDFLDGHQDIKDQIMELQSLLHRPHMEVLSLRSKDRRQGFTDTGELWIAAKQKQRTIKETLGGWVQDLKDQFYNQYNPARRRQAALEKAGVKIDPELDLRRIFDEHPLADNLIYTWLGRIKSEVIDKLAEHDLTQEDLGEYLMLNRVMVGAYHEKAAPGGENPWTARQGLYRLRSQIGLDRWQILERYADRFHDYVYDIMKEAYASGMIGKDEFVNVITPNRSTYAAFRPISYVEKRVGAGLYSITGFLEVAENPFFTTILKMIAFRRGIQWHRTKDASVKFLKTYYPSDIKKAKLDKHGKPLRVENPRETGIISVREDGKWKNYEVPADYARMFDPPALPSVVNAAVRALHWTFRSGFYQTFVKFNPAFQLIRSPVRDFGRLYTNMPSGVSARKLASEYLKAIPVAARRLKGQVDPIVMEMYENFAFSTPHDTFARNMQKHDPLEMIMQEYHILPESKKAAWRNNFLVKIIEGLGDKIVFAGQVLEAAPKIAAYKINTRDLGWKQEKAASFIRNYIGVPNYLSKGSHAFAAGAVMPFWTVATQGLVADAKLLSGHEETVSVPKMAGKKIAVRAATWWLKFTMATGIFAILQALARHGLFGDDLKELYAGISDYTHTNYMVIPLGQTEGGDFGHKTLFLQIPQDEVSRMIGGLLKKTIDMAAERINDDPHDPFFNEIAQLFGFAGGQLPGYHPIPVIAGRWNEYMRGQNPYDTFRGQHILTRDQFLAGGWESLKPMLGMTFNETGLTNFFRFNPDYDSTTEALVTHIPILQSVLKVSDYGNLEKQQRDISEPKEAAAQLRLGALPDNVYKVLKQYNVLRSLGKHKTEYQTQRYDQLKVWYKNIYKPTFESAKRELDMGGDPRPIMDTIEGATEDWE